MAIAYKNLDRFVNDHTNGRPYNSWTRTATGAGTWNVPVGFSGIVYATLVGAGGGGGGANTSSYEGAGGGGGFIYYRWPLWVDYADATSYSITVGAGGTGNSSGATDAPAGGNTSFGTRLIAYGGGGGGGGRTDAAHGGEGGQIAAVGATNSIVHGSANTRVTPNILTTHTGALGFSFWCAGGNGGPGDDGVNNSGSGQSTLGSLTSTTWLFPVVNNAAIGVGGSGFSIDATLYGLNAHGESGTQANRGGGGSLGWGGESQPATEYLPQTNGGGGGGGEIWGEVGQNGADGLAILEYFY